MRHGVDFQLSGQSMMATANWKNMVEFMVGRGGLDEMMVVSSENGAMWASSNPDTFYLREYPATITQEDGTEREETVNEAKNMVLFMKGQKPAQGLRINGKKKEQITRSFKDEETGQQVIFTKVPQGGSCIANAGKCILIGTFNEAKGHSSPQCNETITMMATYLFKSTWPNRNDGESGGGGGGGAPADWQQYVDKMLIGKGNIAQAMIVEVSSGKVLASTPDFALTKHEAEIAQEDGTDKLEMVDETQNILKLTKGTKTSQGLRINQVKYQVIRTITDENSQCYSVYGKKTMGGCAVVLCDKVVLIATFDETKQHSAPGCNAVVSDLAKYLKEALGKT